MSTIKNRGSFVKRSTFLVLAYLMLLAMGSSANLCAPSEIGFREWELIRYGTNRTYNPQWFPSGNSIAISFGDGDTYVVRSDGSSLRRISSGKGDYEVDYSPDISPDGSRVVYATSKYKSRGELGTVHRDFEIETSRLDGSDRRRLTDTIDIDTSPAWSPDGARIAFVRLGEGSGFYTIATDGTDERLVVPFGEDVPGTRHDYGPVWSPDGRTIAFSVGYHFYKDETETTVGFRSVVYAMEVDGSGLRRLFVDSGDYYLTVAGPLAWSPDGQTIAFSYSAGSPTTPRGEWDTKLYKIGRNGDGLQEIPGSSEVVSGLGGIGSLEWSPDGANILLATGSVYLINIDGSEIHRLASGNYASWSSDGSRIAVISTDPNAVLRSMLKDGSDVRVLARINEDGRLAAGNPG